MTLLCTNSQTAKSKMNKNVYTKIFLKQLGESIAEHNVKGIMPLWWYNTREKEVGGLRLTEEGLDVVHKLELTTYDIPWPLDMTLTTQIIIVTNEKKAVELSLFSGDLRKYGLTKALSRQKKEKKDTDSS